MQQPDEGAFMLVTCPFCTGDMESDKPLQDGQHVQCPHCQKHFEYSAVNQDILHEIRTNAQINAGARLLQDHLLEFKKKEEAKARQIIRAEFYKNSCFPEVSMWATKFVGAGFIVSCIMWYKFAMAFESPAAWWYIALGLCMCIPMLMAGSVYESGKDAAYVGKKHRPRAMAALATCIIIIAAVFVQLLAGYAHCRWDKLQKEHKDTHAQYISDLIRDKKEEVRRRILNADPRIYERIMNSDPRTYDSMAVSEIDRNRIEQEVSYYIQSNKEILRCSKCYEYERAYEDYKTDLKTLHWMCWIGVGLALIVYGMAYDCRREELLS